MKSLLLIAFLFLSFTVDAATYYWRRGAAGDWNDPNSWSTVNATGPAASTVPGATDDVYFNDGNANCSLAEAITISTLTIDGYNGTINLSGFTLTVTNSLVINSGTISTTAAALLIVDSSGTLQWTSGVIDSNVTLKTTGASQITIQGVVANGPVDLDSKGTLSTDVISNVTFINTMKLTYSGGADFNISSNTYKGDVAWTTSKGNIVETGNEVFEQKVTLTSDPAGSASSFIYVASSSSDSSVFKGVLTLSMPKFNSTINFGSDTNGNFTAGGKTILDRAYLVVSNSNRGVLSIYNLNELNAHTQPVIINGYNVSFLSCTWQSEIHVSLIGAGTFNKNTFNGRTLLTTLSSSAMNCQNNVFNKTAYFKSGTGVFGADKPINLGRGTETFQDSIVLESFGAPINVVNNAVFKGYIVVKDSNGDAAITTTIIFGTNPNAIMTFSGSADQTFTVDKTNSNTSNAIFFGSVTINKPAGALVLNAPLEIARSAVFTNGIIKATTAAPVIFRNNSAGSATGMSNSSYVDGPVRKIGTQAFTFPVGQSGIYRPISISAPTSTSDAFTAQFFKGSHGFTNPATFDPSLVTVSSCEYWTLNRTNGTSSVQVTLAWNNQECTGNYVNDPSTLAVARWDGAQWVNQGNGGTTGTTASGTVKSSSVVTSFSPFAIATTNLNNPLPVTLSWFKAADTPAGVEVTWETAQEESSDYFLVERSSSLDNFNVIGKLRAAGNSMKSIQYSFIDVRPLAGTSYYRLRQLDMNGDVAFSAVRAVVRDSELQVYPNPASDRIYVSTPVNANVVNALGNSVKRVYQSQEIDIADLPAGIYLIVLSTDTTHRIIKQ